MLPKNNLDRVKEFKESLNPWINEQGIDEEQKKNRRQASTKIIDVYKNSKTELDLSDNQITSLPETIGNLTSLQELYLSENQLTSLPETIGNLNSLQILNLSDNQITSLPETIGNLTSLQRLFLINNDQLSNTPETVSILENLELVNNHNDGFILGWPEHLDRNILVTKIKSLICDAYKEYYSSKPEIAEKIGINEPIDEETTPFLRLAHRFMKESLDERGSMKKIVDMMLPVAESIKKDPSLLEHIDASASIHTDACINQPVAGLTEIANIIDVVKAETIPEKLEKVKVIMAINVIRQEVGKFNRKGVEAELANAMLREVHNKLLSEGEIKEKWSGIPDGIAYERLVKNLLVDEVVNKIKEKVILELNKPLEVVADNVCEGTLGDFWSKIILDKEYLSKINESEDVLTIKSQIEKLDNNDEEYQKKIEELSKELKKAELSCKEKILTKSREETFKAIEANPPSKSPTPSGKEHPQGSESRKM
ncbi:MAG: leucine-rich repeat domain-containing protein [Proteobacteria bacterium]|nr:leucine-rich repeat domain-containing protein [Pseudomonadota bacterium]